MSEHNHGHHIVRRIHTPEGPAAWPEYVAAGTTLTSQGWGAYCAEILRFMGTAAVRAVQLVDKGGTVSDIEESSWNLLLYMESWANARMIPCPPGIGADIVEYVVDERCFTNGNEIGIEVVCYAPHSDDKLEDGVRLPVTSVEKLTHEVGRFTIKVGAAPPRMELSGVFSEDKKAQALAEQINK